MISLERRKGFSLTEDYPSNGDLPFVSVLVAAKDEQENIENCVRSMLQQDYPSFEMIVCNDRSTDSTAEIVAGIAKQDPRVRLINIEHLPEGWGGKNHAMHTGIAQASGQWLCMIDADCRQTSRGTLRSAVSYALDTKADMLSVLPTLEMRGFWENAVQPVCSGVMMIWFHPDKVNSPRHRNAYANGAFMLMRRATYEAVGGHEAVKAQVNEDMHMAARVKAAGLNLRVVRNKGLYLTRMYTSLRQIMRGWSRIFYGTFVTFRRIAISLAVLMIVSMLPYLCAALGLAMWGLAGGAWWLACGLAGAATIALQIAAIWRFSGLIDGRPELAWTYPLGCAIAGIALITALTKLRKGAKLVWRNTTYATAGQIVQK